MASHHPKEFDSYSEYRDSGADGIHPVVGILFCLALVLSGAYAVNQFMKHGAPSVDAVSHAVDESVLAGMPPKQ